MSVREMLADIRKEVIGTDVTAVRASELAMTASALLANISAEILDADMAYNAIFANFLDTEGKANRAKIRAELTPEYRRKREAHDLHAATMELVRSLRKMQDAVSSEARLQR